MTTAVATFERGDVVSMLPKAMKPFLRHGVCTEAELQRLTVCAISTRKDGAILLKLRNAAHQSVGLVLARDLVLVKRGEG